MSAGAWVFPKYFEIETINACNARCRMCTVTDWNKQDRLVMSDSLFEKFVDEVSSYSHWIETVCLNKHGEPTLDKKLPEKVRMLKAAGIKKTTFATNAQLLKPPLAEKLFDAGLDDVMISLDAITKETFETIRVRLNYDVVLQNTLELIRLRNQKNSDMTIRVRMVLMDENRHEFPQWLDFWKSKLSSIDQIYAKPEHTWGNQWGTENQEKIERYATVPCQYLFSSMVIQVDGKVPLCAVDYNTRYLMGHFARQSIREIWTDKACATVRKIHEEGQRNKIKMCQGCSIWDESTKTALKPLLQ